MRRRTPLLPVYRPCTSAQWQSVPAFFLAALLVLALFAVLPFVNHIDARRTARAAGDLSVVAIAPVRGATETSPRPSAPRLPLPGPFPLVEPTSRPGAEPLIAPAPVVLPRLESYEPGTKDSRAFVVDEADLDVPPLPFHRTRPEYPFTLRRDGVGGTVTVEFRVDAEGRVFDVAVIEASHAEFGESVARAVLHWRFVPGTVRGDPVSFRMRLPVRFAIEERPPRSLPGGETIGDPR